MYKNPYEVLGLPDGASKEDVEAAYIRLRDKYRLDMHSEGAKGKAAAKMLEEVENAHNDILVNYAEGGIPAAPTYESGYSSYATSPEPEIVGGERSQNDYGQIESLIRDKRFSDAQRALDDIDNRNADWHYYQSVLYYKSGRMQESKAQLELACSMDPSNLRYRNSLDKLNAKIDGSNSYSQNGNVGNNVNNGYQRSYYESDTARNAEDGCCAACQTMICLNCLCDCCCRG